MLPTLESTPLSWSAALATCHLARLATDLDTEHGGTDAN